MTVTSSHNTGAYLQSQLGLFDRVFLTYGLRSEWNPGFGSEANPSLAPRYGIAITHEMSWVTAKLRGSWGQSTRPPLAENKVAQSASSRNVSSSVITAFGDFDFYTANPSLGPEHQSGAEGGIELYFANRASLSITRYNQTVDNLIIQIQGVDSIRSLIPTVEGHSDAGDGHRWYRQYQHLNAVGIRNQGWELQGSFTIGPLTSRGTYSWTKSRVMGVTEQFAPLVTNQPNYAPGASARYLPEHTWAAGFTYARGATSVLLNLTGTGMIRTNNNAFYNEHITSSIRLMDNRATTRSWPWDHWSKGYTMAHLNVAHRISPNVEGTLQIQNLADHYQNDYSAATAVMGRQTKFGLRFRL